jgi:hypothetical protein
MAKDKIDQLTEIVKAQIKPMGKARLPERMSDVEKDLFGASKPPRIEHGQ